MVGRLSGIDTLVSYRGIKGKCDSSTSCPTQHEKKGKKKKKRALKAIKKSDPFHSIFWGFRKIYSHIYYEKNKTVWYSTFGRHIGSYRQSRYVCYETQNRFPNMLLSKSWVIQYNHNLDLENSKLTLTNNLSRSNLLYKFVPCTITFLPSIWWSPRLSPNNHLILPSFTICPMHNKPRKISMVQITGGRT